MKRTVIAFLLLVACTQEPVTTPSEPDASSTANPPSPDVTSPSTRPSSPVFSVEESMELVRALAAIGPREATSSAYRRAAELVEERFREVGYGVRRHVFAVPRGVSWGVPVPAGRTFNVIAEPAGLDREEPHVLVGAHLDTVPQSPGANDNASGIAIVLELAGLVAREPTPLPIVFVAFGAEEPRASGDAGHHYGSQHYASSLTPVMTRALLGVISIDRVGAGPRALVCTGGRSPLVLRDALLRTARRLNLPARACDNRTSDHWPFERAGETVARLDGGRFPGYHSARDVASRVSTDQVGRVGVIAWETLRLLEERDFA